MTTLSQLNASSKSPIEFTDVRPAGVIFDRFATRDDIFTVGNLNRQLVPQIGINEIINYATANVRYRLTINSTRAAFITGSTLTFNGMPTGVTVSTSTSTYTKQYTVSGFKSAANWEQIKTPTWNIPTDFALSNTWWVKTEIIYYDASISADVTRSWYVFDPRYYYFAQLSSQASVTATVGNKKPFTAALTSSFDFQTDGPFKKVQAAITARVYVTANGRKARLLSANISTAAATFTAQGKYFRAAGRGSWSSAFTVSCQAGEIVRPLSRIDLSAIFGPIGPGGVPYLEGNGYSYPPGSPFEYLNKAGWTWPGINRFRNTAIPLTSTTTVSCIGADARLFSAMVMSAGTMTVTGRRLAGLTLNASVVSTQSVTPITKWSARSNLVANGGLLSILTGPVRLAAAITSTATITATATRIKQIASSQSSIASISAAISRTRRSAVALTAQSSFSADGFLNNPLTVNYTITATTGGGTARTVYLPMSGTVACQVQWGDGTVENFTTSGIKSHQYSTTGSKVIKIYRLSPTGTALEIFGALPYADRGSNPGYSERDVWWGPANTNWYEGVTTFGNLGLVKIPLALQKVGGTVSNIPTSIPSSITDLSYARLPNSSTVVGWNVINVTTASRVFASDFNQAIGTWNVSGLTDATEMFASCTSFNQTLNLWNVSNVTTMSNMFSSCTAFNQSLNSWNTNAVTNMGSMFSQCYAFNGNITSWNTSAVTEMGSMFYDCRAFNQAIGGWNTGAVTNMSGMFQLTRVFNQPLNSWNVSNVTNMSSMFLGARVFNQPLNSWNTAKVTNMNSMFQFNTATAFDQDISSWSVPLIPSKPTDFDTGTLSSWTTAEKPNWGV